jgi:hypothetical protein
MFKYKFTITERTYVFSKISILHILNNFLEILLKLGSALNYIIFMNFQKLILSTASGTSEISECAASWFCVPRKSDVPCKQNKCLLPTDIYSECILPECIVQHSI